MCNESRALAKTFPTFIALVIRLCSSMNFVVDFKVGASLKELSTFTTLVRVLADDKDTAWNRHGYTSRVTGVHEGNT